MTTNPKSTEDSASRREVPIPKKMLPIFRAPLGGLEAPYRWFFGGRGGGKSQAVATVAPVFGMAEPLRILCTRELHVSIRESFHQELKDAIKRVDFLDDFYDVGENYIRGRNGTEFIFRGLRHNSHAIKSLAKIDLTIVEEAEDVPEQSWLDLEATIFRQPKSELWALWNPRIDGSPVDMRFRKNPPKGGVGVEVNWHDNYWFPEGLEKLRQRQRELLDPATYAHIWEGAYLQNSDAQVFSGCFVVEPFEPTPAWDGPYPGMDFGFAQDPTAAVEAWVKDDTLYVYREAGRIGLELDDTAEYMKRLIPSTTMKPLPADSARPEAISYLRRHGLSGIYGVEKGPSSVVDGISFIKSFKQVVIHPNCKETIREFRTYSYKVDRLTNKVVTPYKLVDANNHYIDALRYALKPIQKAAGGSVFFSG